MPKLQAGKIVNQENNYFRVNRSGSSNCLDYRERKTKKMLSHQNKAIKHTYISIIMGTKRMKMQLRNQKDFFQVEILIMTLVTMIPMKVEVQMQLINLVHMKRNLVSKLRCNRREMRKWSHFNWDGVLTKILGTVIETDLESRVRHPKSSGDVLRNDERHRCRHDKHHQKDGTAQSLGTNISKITVEAS